MTETTWSVRVPYHQRSSGPLRRSSSNLSPEPVCLSAATAAPAAAATMGGVSTPRLEELRRQFHPACAVVGAHLLLQLRRRRECLVCTAKLQNNGPVRVFEHAVR